MLRQMKTNEIADEIGVSPRTVRDWVKRYKIPCNKNAFGHYVYNEQAVQKIKEINGEDLTTTTKQSRQLKKERDEENVTNMEQLENILSRLKIAEIQIQQKADDVVSYQLLQQRKEIEELSSKVEALETKLIEMEEKLQASKPRTTQIQNPLPLKPKRRGIAKAIFSIF